MPESRNYTRSPLTYDRAEARPSARSARDVGSIVHEREPNMHLHPDNLRGLELSRIHSERHARERERMPSFTPNFAPARLAPPTPLDAASDAFRDRHDSVLPPSAHLTPQERLPSYFEAEDARPLNDTDFPPLRRMGRRTIADGPLPASSLRESWSPATTVDGLGDRERSYSPGDDHDTWDTMLTTIAPDTMLPSADSSFTSAAASASFSNSHPSSTSGSSTNSANSSRTHLTVPSEHAEERACVSDDDSDSDGSDYSEVDEQEEQRHRDNPYQGLANITNMARETDGSRFRETFHSFASRSSRPRAGSRETVSPTGAAHVASQDQELEQMREILERLARRDDIPEDFWISAGLTRTLAEPVERDSRERVERSLRDRVEGGARL